MAFTGKAVADESVIIEDLADAVFSNSYTITPVLTLFGDAMAPATDVTHSWPETDIRGRTGQLNEALDNSETAVDVDDGTLYAADDIIQVDDEHMFVVSIATNTLTVTRGYAGSTPTTHADNAKVWISSPRLEGADATGDVSTSRSEVANYTEIFSDEISVSRTIRNVNTAGVADEFEFQTQQRLVELMQQLERKVLYGRAHATTPRGSSSIARTMKGAEAFISTNDYEASGAALTEDLLMDQIVSFYAGGMRSADLILCNIQQKSKLSRMNRQLRFIEGGATIDRIRLDQLETDAGVMNIVLSENVKPDHLFFIDSSRVAVPNLEGSSFQVEDLGKVGDSSRRIVVGEYTLEFTNENAHGIIRGLATS